MKTIRFEHVLYLLAFLLALGVRLLTLGKAPLSDFEAGWALQSLALARGETVALGANPGYIFLTTVLFFLFKDTNFLARLWPALAGSLLVLAPFAFRDRLGRKAAVIVAFGLALDPGMVALSRLAGGPMPAIAFTILALAFFAARQFAWGGIAAGLALLSGPAVITGLLGLGIAYGLARLTGLLRAEESSSGENPSEGTPRDSSGDWRLALLFGGGTILFVGTLFFRYPQGLGAWAATLNVYLQSWSLNSGIPAGRQLAAIFFYAVLALLFGLVGAVRGWVSKDKAAQVLSIWFLIAGILPMLPSGRQVGDIAWVLLPLWALAGMELARYTRPQKHKLVSLGQAAGILVLMIVIWLTLAALDTAASDNLLNYWVVLGATITIAVLVILLVYFTWSWEAARNGLVWGLVLGLGAYSIASVFWVSQLRPSTPLEWWVPPPTTRHADLFMTTIENLAITENGRVDYLEITSLVDSPSLRWVLRNIQGVSYAASLDPDVVPLVVITKEDEPVNLRQDVYRGQDFGWWESPGWGGVLPWEPLDWMIDRQAALVTENIILWARVDLFPEDPMTSEEPSDGLDVEESSPSMDEGVDVEE